MNEPDAIRSQKYCMKEINDGHSPHDHNLPCRNLPPYRLCLDSSDLI